MEIIRAENISLKYFTSSYVLRDVNLSIKEGELVLITGPSGCGKSTLIYCLAGIIPHHITVEKYEGKVLIEGKDTKETPYSELVKSCGVVLQNPTSQIFGMTVEDDIVFGLENLCFSKRIIKKRLEKILKLIDMKRYRSTDPHYLSGGEKQKLVIGSILAMEPKILFLDEPTSNLDSHGTKEVLHTLNKLRKMKKTIIIVERKIEHIAPHVDRVIALNDGRLVFDSDPRGFFSNTKLIKKLGVNSPQVVRLTHELKKRGINITEIPLSVEELKKQLLGIMGDFKRR